MFHFVPFVGFTTTKQNGASTYSNFPPPPRMKSYIDYKWALDWTWIGLDTDYNEFCWN